MANNVTCVSCHDLHTPADPALAAGGQAGVCTTCHKTQASGIHGRKQMAGMNPPCTHCHNPHAIQRPQGVMLDNDSKGCRRCHKLDAMATSDRVSSRAKTYHKVMETGDNTCIDCHIGVAHGDPDASEPFMPLPLSEREIVLFHPGISDADWLLTRHRGSQPLRQGTSCRQCHRGEEADLGVSLGGPEPATRSVTVGFGSDDGALVTTLSWAGAEDDTRISLMWGFGDNPVLRRGGCWAACHGDMRGMTLEGGGVADKYLWSSLARRPEPGKPSIARADTELAREIAAGNFAELWSIDLRSGSIAVNTLLAGISPLQETGVTAEVSFGNGRWIAVVRRPQSPPAPLVALAQGRAYTFGIALHGMGRAGSDHWVSLPMTLSMDDDDTDFITH
jgi:predicted CXXCH cytochrome family protein